MSQSFDALRERLLRAGIAPRHVRRYLRELGEHLSDLTAKEIAADYNAADAALRARAALGYDDNLAEAMIAQRKFRSLSVRAPWLVFGLAPPVFVLVVLLLPAFAMFGFVHPYITPHGHILQMPDWYRPLTAAICGLANFSIGPFAALFFIALALRQRMSSVWLPIGLIVVAIFGAIASLVVRFPAFDGDKVGAIAVGFLAQTSETLVLRLCLTLVLATAVYFVLRAHIAPHAN